MPDDDRTFTDEDEQDGNQPVGASMVRSARRELREISTDEDRDSDDEGDERAEAADETEADDLAEKVREATTDEEDVATDSEQGRAAEANGGDGGSLAARVAERARAKRRVSERARAERQRTRRERRERLRERKQEVREAGEEVTKAAKATRTGKAASSIGRAVGSIAGTLARGGKKAAEATSRVAEEISEATAEAGGDSGLLADYDGDGDLDLGFSSPTVDEPTFIDTDGDGDMDIGITPAEQRQQVERDLAAFGGGGGATRDRLADDLAAMQEPGGMGRGDRRDPGGEDLVDALGAALRTGRVDVDVSIEQPARRTGEPGRAPLEFAFDRAGNEDIADPFDTADDDLPRL